MVPAVEDASHPQNSTSTQRPPERLETEVTRDAIIFRRQLAVDPSLDQYSTSRGLAMTIVAFSTGSVDGNEGGRRARAGPRKT